MRKLSADLLSQRAMEFAKELAGCDGLIDDRGPYGIADDRWNRFYLYARAATIGGGSVEIQRNIVSERVLGLPR